jgi:hypothetical protein
MTHHHKATPAQTMFVIPAFQPVHLHSPARRVNPDDASAVLLLKPAASLILRTQPSRSMLHTHIGALTRAKHALELSGCPNSACPEQVPLIRIAVSSIGGDLSSAKMALLNSEEALREAHSCARALQMDSALYKAAGLVLVDYEKDRLTLGTLMNQVRDLYLSYRNTLN